MLSRILIAAVFTSALSSAAFASCNCSHQSAYDVSQDNGVTVMRGNIPTLHNTQWRMIADRKAAEKRADKAERRANKAQREARDAKAALAARPANTNSNYGYGNRRQNPYFSGDYRYGASVSRSGGRGRGSRNFGGNKTISRPVFSNAIRF